MSNDRTAAVLEKYEIEVLRLWKGRGAVLCETPDGIRILKEYGGNGVKLNLQHSLLTRIRESGYPFVEQILPSKEGELLVKEEDGTAYCLKEYSGGRECNLREHRDCMTAAANLGRLHMAMEQKELAKGQEVLLFHPIEEMEKQNRELRKIRKYLKEKKRKTEFEYFLQSNFNFFLEKAEQVLEEMKTEEELFCAEDLMNKGSFCHGDVQHHNILMQEGKGYFINFEKILLDSPVRDLSLFFRKMMEKNHWSWELGKHLLKAYEKERPLSEEEQRQMYYRLSYPEKFRKIVNFYYNSPKSRIPEKNREKLEKLLYQETLKTDCLRKNFSM